MNLTWTKHATTLGVGPSVLLLLEREGRDLERPIKCIITNYGSSSIHIYPDTLVSLGLYSFFLLKLYLNITLCKAFHAYAYT